MLKTCLIKEIRSIFRAKNLTKDQIRKYKRRKKEMSRIIKNCRGEKKESKSNNKRF